MHKFVTVSSVLYRLSQRSIDVIGRRGWRKTVQKFVQGHTISSSETDKSKRSGGVPPDSRTPSIRGSVAQTPTILSRGL